MISPTFLNAEIFIALQHLDLLRLPTRRYSYPLVPQARALTQAPARALISPNLRISVRGERRRISELFHHHPTPLPSPIPPPNNGREEVRSFPNHGHPQRHQEQLPQGTVIPPPSSYNARRASRRTTSTRTPRLPRARSKLLSFSPDKSEPSAN